MGDIIYTYKNQVYANITNKCDCACTFCIRSQAEAIGEATALWHKKEPSLEEILAAVDAFHFQAYDEFVFCGYGEPTCELEKLLYVAKYVKDKTGLPIRLNTNGLGNLYHKKDIIPALSEVIDSVSISMNAADADTYQKVTRPSFPDAYHHMLDFAEECQKSISKTQLSIVDILSEDQIEACRSIASERGVYLKIRHFTK